MLLSSRPKNLPISSSSTRTGGSHFLDLGNRSEKKASNLALVVGTPVEGSKELKTFSSRADLL